MSNWGAGDPSDGTSPTGYYPWGAGDPSPTFPWGDGADVGAGDPSLSLVSAGLLPYQAGDHLYPDDGGELLRITAAWNHPGPYTVQLTEMHSGQTFTCYGGPGRGTACVLDASGVLTCGLPPVPPGWYNVTITWAAGSATISAALRVIWRARSRCQWQLAARFRSADQPGPRDARGAPLLGVSDA